MKKYIKIGFVLIALGLLSACGQKVEVPPGAQGVVIGKNGVIPEPIPPRKFRLSPCIAYCDQLTLVYTIDQPIYENMELFIPKDKLVIKYDIRGVVSIPSDKKTILSVINKIPQNPSPMKKCVHIKSLLEKSSMMFMENKL